MKVITDLNLLKRLQPILEDRETEYFLWHLKGEYSLAKVGEDRKRTYLPHEGDLKTLQLEEAIDLLPCYIEIERLELEDRYHSLMFHKLHLGDYRCYYGKIFRSKHSVEYIHTGTGKTLLEAVEKLILNLLDNNLLGQTK